MAKTKQTVVAELEQEVKKTQPRPTKKEKKEKKALAEARKKEMAQKRFRYTALALVLAGGAVAVNFGFNSYYGTDFYEWIQIGCFLMMGTAGGVMMFGSKYEETEKQQRSKRTTGLVFVVIALGVIMSELVQIFMK